MATNHTENYALNLWEPQDAFLRTEFNENTEKLDAALKAEADARSALVPAVGTYQTSQTEDVEIDLGFRPKAVLLVAAKAIAMVVNGNGRCVYSNNTYAFFTGAGVQLTDQGFRLNKNASHLNDPTSSTTVWYIAFR